MALREQSSRLTQLIGSTVKEETSKYCCTRNSKILKIQNKTYFKNLVQIHKAILNQTLNTMYNPKIDLLFCNDLKVILLCDFCKEYKTQKYRYSTPAINIDQYVMAEIDCPNYEPRSWDSNINSLTYRNFQVKSISARQSNPIYNTLMEVVPEILQLLNIQIEVAE